MGTLIAHIVNWSRPFYDAATPDDLSAALADGWKQTSQFEAVWVTLARPHDIEPFLAGELGRKGDAVHFAAEYNRVRDWANKNLWDEEMQFYYPVVRATGKKLLKRSNVAFWLLWAGIPDKRQKDAQEWKRFAPGRLPLEKN